MEVRYREEVRVGRKFFEAPDDISNRVELSSSRFELSSSRFELS
jgi:hypothetical protein